jgi:hypothetical protein
MLREYKSNPSKPRVAQGQQSRVVAWGRNSPNWVNHRNQTRPWIEISRDLVSHPLASFSKLIDQARQIRRIESHPSSPFGTGQRTRNRRPFNEQLHGRGDLTDLHVEFFGNARVDRCHFRPTSAMARSCKEAAILYLLFPHHVQEMRPAPAAQPGWVGGDEVFRDASARAEVVTR